MSFKVLDLFSGAGGMAEGFLQAGFTIPYASDISEQAKETYTNRHRQLGRNIKFFQGDINELKSLEKLEDFLGEDINNIDVVTGGPPCQGFSLAGRRDENDVRNKLIHSYIEVLETIKPKYFVMENVLGILSSELSSFDGLADTYKNEKLTDMLDKEFEHIGYSHVIHEVMDASHYGVPQKRMRVIFLGTRDDIYPKLKHPEPTLDILNSAQSAIADLENISIGRKVKQYNKTASSSYQLESRQGRTPDRDGQPIEAISLYNHETSRHTAIVTERFKNLRSGENIRSMLARLPPEQAEKLATKKNNCKKIIADQPSPTVLTLPDDLVHYKKNRIMTVREMARLQSFDDSFEFLGKRTTGGDRRKSETPQYTLVGNAVPPLLAKAIGDEIMKCLIKSESTHNITGLASKEVVDEV
ncbi:DNA cytosine methyltransferase [uncultured Psychrobacter sp.]|uniref:DNA cytosine methyltransferase n=1 Tax=uncultured Psychrobacter sp. TaxID=259303 RepID=UPI00262012D5|nr:DNA cytosine methyltransferase [uncultured Psychrobacter sp.]